MRWTITKCYLCELDFDYGVGKKVGPKTLWDKLWEIEEGWTLRKCDGEYTFENPDTDSEVVLTYLNYYTLYDYLNTWLEKGKRFDVEWDNDEFSECAQGDRDRNYDDDEETNYVKDVDAEEVKSIVEDYIYYNFPEEIIDIVIQEVPVEIDGELFCNNPYAHPEYYLDWNINEKEFVILVQSPSYVGNGYIPFEDQLTITMKEVKTWNT